MSGELPGELVAGSMPDHRDSQGPDVPGVQSTTSACTELGQATHLACITDYLAKSEFLPEV